jgi:hypothetical protein
MVRRSTALVVVALIAAPAVGAAGAVAPVAADRATAPQPPQVEVTAPGGPLVSGATQPLTLQVVNDADDPNVRVRNATNVEVEFLGVGVIEPETGPQFVGRLVEGIPRTATAQVSVDDNAVGGVYDVPVAVTYEYLDDTGSIVEEREVVDVTVEVEARPRFEVREVESDVSVGSTGTVSVTVKNVGSAAAASASLALGTTSPSVAFGNSGSAERFVGEWDAGEERTLTYDVTVTPGAEARSYALQGTVNYEDADGAPRQSGPLKFGFAPDEAPSFSVSGLDASLEVGERGTIEGRVTNDGDEPVENAVVVVEDTPPTVTPVEAQYAVGTLEPDETVGFEVEGTVSPQASPGPRQFTLRVTHRGPDGATLAGDPLPVRVTVAPEQTFAVEAVEADLQVGTRGSIEGTVVNTGDRTVEDAVVTVAGSAPTLTPVEPQYAVGTLEPGERANFSLEALAGAEASAGPRQVTLRVGYSGDDGTPRTSDPVDLRVDVAPEQSFDVRDVESTLRVGEQGTIRGTVVNEGDESVEDAVVVFQPSTPTVTPLETEYAVGRLGPGESATFAVEARVAPSAGAGPRQFDFRVQYRNSDGIRRASDPLSARVLVDAGQSFAVEGVESTLRVGAEGNVTGTLINTGNRTVENAVVALQASSPTLSAVEPEYAVGTIEPGERVEFDFDVEVSESAEAGPRQVTFQARYRSAEGEPRSSDPLDARVSVSSQRDTFAIEVVDGRVPAGSSDTVRVQVRNEGAQRLADLSAKVYDGAPLSAEDDEAFVERLAPGETTTMTFEVSVGGGAIANKTYPLQLDFRYDDADGEQTVSDIYRLPVTADPPRRGGGGGGLLSLPVVVALVVVVVAVVGVVLYRRRT